MATDYTIPKEEYRALVAENARLRDLMYDRAHDHAIQHMTEDELRITAVNALDECAKLRDELDAAKHDLSLFSERIVELGAENAKLHELLDFALPIAMYAASTEEGDRMRELMREVEL